MKDNKNIWNNLKLLLTQQVIAHKISNEVKGPHISEFFSTLIRETEYVNDALYFNDRLQRLYNEISYNCGYKHIIRDTMNVIISLYDVKLTFLQ